MFIQFEEWKYLSPHLCTKKLQFIQMNNLKNVRKIPVSCLNNPILGCNYQQGKKS